MSWLWRALIVVAGLINFAPVLGAFLPERMEALYGVAIDTPNLEVLLRHRAVLFGVVGGLLFATLVNAVPRRLAYVVGFVSMVSFLLVVWSVGGTSEALSRVVTMDLIGIAALAGAVALDRHAPGA